MQRAMTPTNRNSKDLMSSMTHITAHMRAQKGAAMLAGVTLLPCEQKSVPMGSKWYIGSEQFDRNTNRTGEGARD